MLRIAHFVVFLLAVSSCFVVHAAESAYRLDSAVEPTFQQISLTLDPDNLDFSGSTIIDINVTQPVTHIGFYQSDLNIKQAELVSDGESFVLTIDPAQHDIQHAKTGSEIAAGHYQLTIAFDGQLNTTSDGAYISKFEGRNYISTQFEDMLARKAFPSFDEPSNKIPYQLTIRAPEKHVVLSNTPVQQRAVEAGWQTVEFKRTQPMPSYLVAFAVGEYDSIEIQGLSVPGRIYAPKGQAHLASFAAKHTPAILDYLEGYFATPYPYQKLDFVAVPTFTHGAMENVGLVTYRTSILLRGDKPILTEQATPLMVVAHELAHMWYGNLVTMAWWDDLWLNEAFASFMAGKLMEDLYPEHNYAARLVAENAFDPDAAATTRPVKKEVKVNADVMEGLGLNYSKGEATLQWIESQIGAPAFQAAIREYMKEFAWQNAEADDLWRALAGHSEIDIPSIMRTYLEQSSYPLISVTEDGTVSQQRYRLAGAKVAEQQWVVPIELLVKRKGKITKESILLSQPSAQFKALADAQWVFPNHRAKGYYRWQISAAQRAALLSDLSALSALEKKSMLYNFQALLKAGHIGVSDMMTVLNRLAEDDDPMVVRAVASTLAEYDYLVNEQNQALFGEFLDDSLQAWLEQLGTQDSKTDSDEVTRLRHAVFGLLSSYTSNPKVLGVAESLAEQYLAEPDSDRRQMAYRAMRAVAKRGDKQWLDKFIASYTATNDANVQAVIGSAMLFPGQAERLRVLDFAMSDAVNSADTIGLVAEVADASDDHVLMYQWLTENVSTLIEKLPEYHVSRLPEYLSKSCSQSNIKLADAFYQKVAVDYPVMGRSWQIARSNSEQCVALKNRYQQDFTDYLLTRSADSKVPAGE
ncbi:M1 family metallopeptidase [Arenicella xantha]|uniref:Aminopeptidase n=1 Tax=Arenicella xantha TaxID=644221 RepID=A0A395JR10_9GAMM|nr:M1 family metallopeptidase [Arenicella xantha]RBP53803.1 alanyl aminopeptidase [Arenicella xantha]